MKKILFYTSDTSGLGHLRRISLVAEKIKNKDKSYSLSLVGLLNEPKIFGKFYNYLVKLTPLNNGLLKNNAKSIFKARIKNAEKFLDYVRSYKPDLIIADFYLNSPFAFYPINYVLKKIKIRSFYIWRIGETRKSVIFKHNLSKLDKFNGIVLPYNKYELRNWFTRSLYNNIVKNSKFLISGPICKISDPSKKKMLFKKYNLSDNDFIIISTIGGGGDLPKKHGRPASDLIDYLLVNFGELEKRIPNVKLIIFTGPLYKKKIIFKNKKVKCIKFEKNLTELIYSAKLVISSAGYNAGNEIIAAKVPAMLVPRTLEQDKRAQFLQKLGIAKVFRSHSKKIYLKTMISCLDNLKLMEQNFNKVEKIKDYSQEIVEKILKL